MLRMSMMPAWSASSTPPYDAEAVLFDGTDRIKRGAALTSISSGKVGTFSCWFRVYASDGGFKTFIEPGTATGPGIQVYRWNTNKIAIVGRNAANGTILSMASVTNYVNGMSWAHLLASWDLAAGVGHLYVNDADDRAAAPTLTNDTIAYATPTEWTIGARHDGNIPFGGDMCDLYLNTDAYIDITNVTNRRKFITAGLKPVDLGADGSAPTGSQPVIFQKNPLATWPTNVGYGGGFTLTGTLTSASSSPSD